MLFKIISLILLNVNIIQSEDQDYSQNKRKFHLSKDDLSFTKMEPKIDAKPCADHKSVSIFILSTATTAGESYLKRQAQRKTWVLEAKQDKISVYFVIGLSENQTTNQLLREESKQYKDMIQMQFIDHYYNQTLKTVSILRWAQNKCQKSKLIIKTDDDTIVNIDMLLNNLHQFWSGITGFRHSESQVIRDPSNRWWYPREQYIPVMFIPYVLGCFYVITTDAIPKMLATLETYFDPVLDIEDVFVTGILAEKAGVPRFAINPLIIPENGCNLGYKCELSKHIVISDCKSDGDLVKLYETWKKMNLTKEC